MRLRLLGLLACTGTALAAALAGPAFAQQGVAAAARPLVLIVHGRGQVGRDSAEVRRDAWHALQSGMRAIDADVSLQESDVRLVWYADILDVRSAGNAAPSCSQSAGDVGTVHESTPSALGVIALLAGALADAVATEAKGDDASELRGFAGDLRYLSDADTRCAAESRVVAALRQAHRDNRPVILVSHSLGALVSWGALTLASVATDTTLPMIQQWITMGSPLGSAEIRQLVFGDEHDVLALPKTVRSWKNLMATDDFFAHRIARDSVGDSTLTDVLTESAHDDPHLLMSYLTDPAMARLLTAAWHCAGSAADHSRTAPPVCATPIDRDTPIHSSRVTSSRH